MDLGEGRNWGHLQGVREGTFTHVANTLTDSHSKTCNLNRNRKLFKPSTGDHVNRLVSLYNTNQSSVSSVEELEEENILKKKNLCKVITGYHRLAQSTTMWLLSEVSVLHSKNHKVGPKEPN